MPNLAQHQLIENYYHSIFILLQIKRPESHRRHLRSRAFVKAISG